MFSLVVKDILIQKKSLYSMILYPLVGVLALGYSFGISSGYIFSIVSIGYVMVLAASGYDEKNKFDIVINSLPVSRDDAVIAKYLSVLVIFIIATLLTGIAGLLVKISGLFPFVDIINVSEIISAAVTLCIYFSIYFPLNFKFGTIKMKYVNMFLYLAFYCAILAANSVAKQGESGAMIQRLTSFIGGLPKNSLYCLIAAVLLIIVSVSINISIKIYRRKDF
jgi:ABC-type transport system involved in multi-copper enzyme maturation permease subunit